MVDAHLRSKTIETADIKNMIIGGQTGIDGIRFCLAAVTNGENLADPAFSWFLQYKNKNGQGESVGLTPVYENGLVKLPWVPNKLATQVPGRMQIQLYAAIITGEGEAAVVDKQWVSEFAIIYIQENINPDPIVATELTIFDQYLTMYQSYRDASVAAFRGVSDIVNGEDFQTVLSLNNSIPAVAAMDESIPVVAGMSVSVPLVAGVKDEIPVLAPVVSQIEQLALIKDQIVSLEAEKLKVAAVEARLAELQAVHDKLTEIEGVYGKSTEIDTLYAQLATIATKANQADLDAVKGPDWSNQSLVSLDIEKLNKEDNGKLFAYRHPRSPEELTGNYTYSYGTGNLLGFYEKLATRTIFNMAKFKAWSSDPSAQLEYRIYTRTSAEMNTNNAKFVPSSLTPLASGFATWDSLKNVTISLQEEAIIEATNIVIILIKATAGSTTIYRFSENSPTLPNRHGFYMNTSGGWDAEVGLSTAYTYSQTAIELILENETYKVLKQDDAVIMDKIEEVRANVLPSDVFSDNVLMFSKTKLADSGINKRLINHFKSGQNIFNENTLSELGFYMVNGVPVNNQYTANLKYSEYIPVSSGVSYRITSYIHSYELYDHKKNVTTFNVTVTATPGNPITIPQGTSFLVVNTDIRYSNNLMIVVEGTDISEYIPYSIESTYFYNKREIQEMLVTPSPVILKASLNLPLAYHLVVGDTFELFYKGIVAALRPDEYFIDIISSKGTRYRRKYKFTPTVDDIGTTILPISLYDNAGNLIETKNVNLIVKGKASSPASQKNVLCVGDSLTSGGGWVKELYRRLTAPDGSPVGDSLENIRFIGSRKAIVGVNEIGYEGYGGWTFYNFNSNINDNSIVWVISAHDKTSSDQHSIYEDVSGTRWSIETIEATQLKMVRSSGETTIPSSGTLVHISGGENISDIVFSSTVAESNNPFWNESTDSVDFANYASELGISSIDICYVLLGWNSTTLSESTYKAQIRTFINNLRSSYPACQIILIGVQVPAEDGFGVNYGASLSFKGRGFDAVWRFNQWYPEVCAEYTGVEFVQLSGQFDTEYCHLTTEIDINTRVSTKLVIQANGVHPASSGYLQIADAAYRHFHHLLQGS